MDIDWWQILMQNGYDVYLVVFVEQQTGHKAGGHHSCAGSCHYIKHTYTYSEIKLK